MSVLTSVTAREPICGEGSDDAPGDPRWELGPSRLRALVAYGRKVYHLDERFDAIADGRREPVTPAPAIAKMIYATGLLRIRSLNALEPKLDETTFKSLIGARSRAGRVCSADTVARSLVTMKHDPVRQGSISTIAQAERNKVFREGWHGALRYVAIDGWEPFSSYNRCCDHCLIRHVARRQLHLGTDDN
ncbi:MAG: hypothetical protein FJ087_13330 [Deltaproteobacteria bacterium]|nr:hypothetical protein [Deltaproteobacteria bacterium]